MYDLRNWAPLAVGIVIAVAVSVIFLNLFIGATVGISVAAALFWEQRSARRGGGD